VRHVTSLRGESAAPLRRESVGHRLPTRPVLHRAAYYQGLKERYTTAARSSLLVVLRQRGRISYDTAWETILPNPLVWESDLKSWINEWHKQGHLDLEGLGPRERVPKLGQNHKLGWKAR
jgi:hypothetical protein